MKTLGISTATKTLAIGLIDDGCILCEHSVSGEQAQAENLVPYIKSLLEDNRFKIDEVDAIAVTLGPGSYSGLRGGLACAKSLAQILGCKIVGVSTLEAICYNLSAVEGTIMVMTDAVKDELNVALFGAHQGRITRLIEDCVVTGDRVVELLNQVSGELYRLTNIDRPSTLVEGDDLRFCPKSTAEIRGANVARLGLKKINESKSDDFLSLLPRYSHQPKIRSFKH